MCENVINTEQLRLAISQTDETVALAQEWVENLHHLADHAELTLTSTDLAQATVMLGEARSKLGSAMGGLERGASNTDVTVELV